MSTWHPLRGLASLLLSPLGVYMFASRKQLPFNLTLFLRLKHSLKSKHSKQFIKISKKKKKKKRHNLPFHVTQTAIELANIESQNCETTMRRGSGGGGGVDGHGPCGACKFLRRKCVKGCIFAPYFDSAQGTAHFAAVHKVFGASNASKILQSIPPPKRLDACVTLCFEALARVRDPVYGCVSHIFSLQQQVANLQAELAYIQAKISTLQRILPPQLHSSTPSARHPPLPDPIPCPDMGLVSSVSMLLDQTQPVCNETSSSFMDPIDQLEMDEDEDLESLAQEFVSRYFPGERFWPPCS